jgi:DNA-binding CsgD family transcriptional regulator
MNAENLCERCGTPLAGGGPAACIGCTEDREDERFATEWRAGHAQYLDAAKRAIVERAPIVCSTRELEILGLSLDGYSTSAISGQLGLASGTVKRHLDSATAKLADDAVISSTPLPTRRETRPREPRHWR